MDIDPIGDLPDPVIDDPPDDGDHDDGDHDDGGDDVLIVEEVGSSSSSNKAKSSKHISSTNIRTVYS